METPHGDEKGDHGRTRREAEIASALKTAMPTSGWLPHSVG